MNEKRKIKIIDDRIFPEFINSKNYQCNVDSILDPDFAKVTFGSTSFFEEDILNIAQEKILKAEKNKRRRLKRRKEALKKEINIFEKIEELRNFLRKKE